MLEIINEETSDQKMSPLQKQSYSPQSIMKFSIKPEIVLKPPSLTKSNPFTISHGTDEKEGEDEEDPEEPEDPKEPEPKPTIEIIDRQG